MSRNKSDASGAKCVSPIILGIICASVKLVSIIISAPPYDMIHKLDPNGVIPSIWIWNLTGCIMMFVAGMAAGTIVHEVSSGKLTVKKEREAYKGGLYFISAYFLTVIHYPLFFAGEHILVSFFISVVALICTSLCAILWSRISSKACIMTCSNAFFSLYVAFINLNILAIN